VHGTDTAGVGQRDRRARVILEGQLIVERPFDEVLICFPEFAEVH
jgi:hypothetical protein